MKCQWCGAEYPADTRLPLDPGPDGKRNPSRYCSDECAKQAANDACQADFSTNSTVASDPY